MGELMNPKRTDRAIADALRSAASEPYQGSLDELARRIDAAAVPILAARRQSVSRSVVWWDFAAEWARMLVPIGVTIAAACVAVLWLMRPVAPVAAQSVSPRPSTIAVAVRHGAPAPELVDRAVEELVSMSGAPAARSPR
jgi:negative regulator of sigma E activity